MVGHANFKFQDICEVSFYLIYIKLGLPERETLGFMFCQYVNGIYN